MKEVDIGITDGITTELKTDLAGQKIVVDETEPSEQEKGGVLSMNTAGTSTSANATESAVASDDIMVLDGIAKDYVTEARHGARAPARGSHDQARRVRGHGRPERVGQEHDDEHHRVPRSPHERPLFARRDRRHAPERTTPAPWCATG